MLAFLLTSAFSPGYSKKLGRSCENLNMRSHIAMGHNDVIIKMSTITGIKNNVRRTLNLL